jgi:diketogulonate reductase-like aldo/keto reductase
MEIVRPRKSVAPCALRHSERTPARGAWRRPNPSFATNVNERGRTWKTITLNNGVELPALGLGVFQTPPDETRNAVRGALDVGYRLIDTAAAYGNERQVGEAIHSSEVASSEIFLETKVWISDYGYDETLHAFEKSARKLGVEKLDLLILHQALPSAFDRTVEAYRAHETLLADAKVRAIGISNFMVEHLTRLLKRVTVVPAVNQIECHPYFAQQEVQDFGAEHGILTQAWSPIGGITFYRDGNHGSTLDDPVIADIARTHGKTPAQVMLRWGLQHGRSVIPKSTKSGRIAENIDVFDFELSAEEMTAVDALDTGHRGGPEPEAITLEAFGREIPEA